MVSARITFEINSEGAVISRRTVRPGQMVHLGVKKAGRIPDGGGWRAHGRDSQQARTVAARKARDERGGYTYLHSAVDGHSRLACAEALPDEKSITAIGFMHRA